MHEADTAAAQLAAHYDATLKAHLPPGAKVCVALSGGMDSCALLNIARQGKWTVSACHINHGLSPRAAQWEEFCRTLCAAAQVPLTIHRATPLPQAGEAWARRVRRQVFAQLPVAAVVAAHHADDQAETLLLRLLRGSAHNGIAAMRGNAQVGAVKLLRPWLSVPRSVILDYAKTQRLRWVEDEDNRNEKRRRNLLRHRVLPLLAQEGGTPAQLAAAARRLREGADLLVQLARQDETAARQADGGLALAYFRDLEWARLRNYLYVHLRERGQKFSERLVREAARQVQHGKCEMRFETLILHCWRDALYWEEVAAPPPVDFAREIALVPGRVEVAELGGALELRPARAHGCGLSPAKVGDKLTLRLRQGGEILAPPGRPHRQVGKLLQEKGVPPWQRRRLPLLFAGEKLAAVPGIAVDSAFAAEEGEEGMEVGWVT